MAITNGTFDTDLSGWTIVASGDATVTWESPGRARLEVLGTVGTASYEMSQIFVIDDIALYFQYRCTGNDVYNHWPAWSLTVDIDGVPTVIVNENLNNNYSGQPLVTWTRVIDVSAYVGNTATIKFYDSVWPGSNIYQIVYVDNIGVGKAGSVDFITDPPGANIWLKNLDGTWEEQWNHNPDGWKIDPWITPFTYSQMIPQDYMFKLCGYAEYIDTLVMTGPTETINATLSPSSTIVNLDTYPSGAEIYIDGIDRGIKTPASVILGPIPECIHTLTFRRSGYFDYMRTETLVETLVTISGNMIHLIPIPPCP